MIKENFGPPPSVLAIKRVD